MIFHLSRLKFFLVVFSALCLAECLENSAELNVRTVLLPVFKDVSVNFTLYVTGVGCYKWHLSRDDIVSISPIYGADISCSRKAVITVKTTEFSRKTVKVLVFDPDLLVELDAEIIVDEIHSLWIFSKTRLAYLECPPQLIEARAFDNQRNEFTTLEGIEFEWLVENLNPRLSSPVLRFMSFLESRSITPPSVVDLAKNGKQGHIVVIEGIGIGSSRVRVRLPYHEYTHVEPADIQVLVIQNIELEPTTAYLMPGDSFRFKLFQIRKGERLEIDENDSRYKLVSENSQIASVTGKREVLTHSVGNVEVVVHDISIVDKPDIHSLQLPTALIVVKNPHSIILNLMPFKSWSLTLNQNAIIIPEVFSSDKDKFLIGDNAVIRTYVPRGIFHVLSEGKNGIISGTTSSLGSGLVSAELIEPSKSLLGHKIYAENILYVYPALSIEPSSLVIPWCPFHTPQLKNYSLHANGGDKDYIWSSNNRTSVEVYQNGSLRFYSPGSSRISVSMKKNRLNKVFSDVHIIIPDEMRLVPSNHEVEMWSDVFLSIFLYGTIEEGNETKKLSFDFCNFLDFQIFSKYPFEIDAYSINATTSACSVVKLKSVGIGCSEVIVVLNLNSSILKSHTSLCSQDHVTIHQPPFANDIVLAVGSSYDIVILGGPLPFSGPLQVNYTKGKNIYKHQILVSRTSLYISRIICKRHGSSFFKFILKTRPPRSAPLVSTALVKIYCHTPKIMKVVSRPHCVRIPGVSRIVSTPNKREEINVEIYDDQGRIFQNATSLSYDWYFDNKSIAAFENSKSIYLYEKINKYHDASFYKTPLGHYITILTHNELGVAEGAGALKALWRRGDILASFELLVTKEPVVEPSSISIFNHPNNIGILKIKGGSGNFNFSMNNNIASVKFSTESQVVEVIPKNEGKEDLIITEKCLKFVTPIKVGIQVLNVYFLHLMGPSQIQEGYSGKIFLRLRDFDNKPVAIPVMSVANLGINFFSSNASLAEFDLLNKAHLDNTKGVVEINLKGKDHGDVKLWALFGEVMSNVHDIHIFPRMKISPSELTLVVGSEYQVSVIGGPLSDYSLRYISSDTTISTVSNVGMIKGLKIGRTSITVVAESHGELLSRDTIDILVINLTGVHIVTPTLELAVGNTMPAWVSGNYLSISPLLLGSISPSPIYKWQVSVSNIVQIQDPLSKSNILVSADSRLSVRLHALNPGSTRVEVIVFFPHLEKPMTSLSCYVNIIVFDPLEWVVPNLAFNKMLVAPNSEIQLKTNILKDKKITYSTPESDTKLPVVRVSRDGILRTGSNYGRAAIEAEASDQKLTLNVEVLPVHYLMVNVDTALTTNEKIKSLPRGLYLNMTISYHDKFGNKFFVVPNSKPSQECNICTKIHVDYSNVNHRLVTSLPSTGTVVLRTFNKIGSHEIEDYIKFSVDNYILPNKASVAVGEVICFSTPIISQNFVWSSENDILEMNPNGLAIAKASGFTSVIYSVSYPEPVMMASFPIDILPLHSFLVGPSADRSLTNNLGYSYLIPVFLLHEKSRQEPFFNKNCNRTGVHFHSFPFICSLSYTNPGFYSLEKIFNVREDFDFKTGAFVCAIVPIKGSGRDTSDVNSNLSLTVSDGKSIYETLYLNFYPQFSISTESLVLKKGFNSGIFSIYGTPAVLSSLNFDVSKPKSIYLSTKTEINNVLKVSVKLVFDPFLPPFDPDDSYVVISSPLSKQEHKLLILLSVDQERPKYMLPIDLFIAGLWFGGVLPSLYSWTIVYILYHLIYYRKHYNRLLKNRCSKLFQRKRPVRRPSLSSYKPKSKSKSKSRSRSPSPFRIFSRPLASDLFLNKRPSMSSDDEWGTRIGEPGDPSKSFNMSHLTKTSPSYDISNLPIDGMQARTRLRLKKTPPYGDSY